MIDGQMSIFDWMPTLKTEPAVGEYVETHGAIICHIMRPHYIGEKVVMDKSTNIHKWYQVGILEKYFNCNGVMRAVVYDGSKQRNLIDFYSGVNIYECLPWDAYPKRMEAIGRR